jgi:outer membrane beta-barrel protein
MNKVKLLTLLTLASLGSSSAWADRRNPLEGQPAVRHMVELRKLRFEAALQFITSTNQDYKNAFGPGLNLQFHIFDWLGIGVSGNYTFNSNTPLEDQVRSKLPQNYTYPGPQPSLAIHDQHVLQLNALASAYVSITPWHGKFAMFSALFFNYDFFVNAGLGLVWYQQNGCCTASQDPARPNGMATQQDVANGGPPNDPNLQSGAQFAGWKVGGMIGVGVHVFFNDWLALQLELRDYIVKANPGGLDVNGDRVLTSDDEGPQNNLFFGVGLSFFLPPRAKISR